MQQKINEGYYSKGLEGKKEGLVGKKISVFSTVGGLVCTLVGLGITIGGLVVNVGDMVGTGDGFVGTADGFICNDLLAHEAPYQRGCQGCGSTYDRVDRLWDKLETSNCRTHHWCLSWIIHWYDIILHRRLSEGRGLDYQNRLEVNWGFFWPLNKIHTDWEEGGGERRR